MSDGFDKGPRFPGDLSDHLGKTAPPEPADRWSDRLRHAWFAYLLTAVLFVLWAGGIAASFLVFGHGGWPIAIAIFLAPLVVYARIVQVRHITGRDPETGERMRPPDR